MALVHVVCRDALTDNRDRIVPRLARELVDRAGWSLGNKPNPRADLNYAFGYLEWQQGWPTPAAAWFTHKEENDAAKAEAWEAVAAAVQLRLVCASMYASILCPHGPTAIVTPPIDLEKFRPAARSRKPRARPRVGVAGWVYRTGRKGERLVARLAGALGKNVEIVGAGDGWPVITTLYPWAELERFYQGLDLLVCASTVEGIGYPPMEALAVGVPVVIPQGIGIFDELGDVPGIWRYPRGDYDMLEVAVREALEDRGKIESGALRAAVARYTPEAWVGDHLRAIRSKLGLRSDAALGSSESGSPVPGPSPQARSGARRAPPSVDERGQAATPAVSASAVQASSGPWAGRAGVYMVAFGGPARDCAELAIASIRQRMPGFPVCFVGTEPLGMLYRDEDVFVQVADTDIGGREAKTRMWELAPAAWEYVIYLDADTELVENGCLERILDILADGWEVCICPNPAKYALARDMVRPDNGDECAATFELIGTNEILQYNGGVMAFRRTAATEALITTWHAEWQRWGKRDQAALDRALYAGPVRVWTLSNQWNRIDRYDVATKGTAIVHHPTRARRWTGLLGHGVTTAEKATR